MAKIKKASPGLVNLSYAMKFKNKPVSPVWLILSDGKYKIKLYPGVSLNKGELRNQDGAINHLKRPKDFKKTEEKLKEFKENVQSIYIEAKKSGLIKVTTDPETGKSECYPKADYFKQKIEELKASKQEPEIVTIWDVWNQYVNTKAKEAKSPRFIQNLESLKKHLISFEDYIGANKKLSITFHLDEIDKKFLNQFMIHMSNDKELEYSSVHKYVKLFRMFLNWSFDYGYTNSREYKKLKIITPKRKEPIVLSDEELNKIRSLDLSKSPSLENARRWLILSTETGMRISDLSRINQSMLVHKKGITYLKFIAQKNKKLTEIPLGEEEVQILQSIIEKRTRAISSVKLNVHYKEIGKLAGIDDPVNYHGQEVPKYSTLSTKVGRKSFITNLLQRGFTVQEVMKYSGHSSEEEMRPYINLVDSIVHEKLLKAKTEKQKSQPKMWIA